MAPIAPTLAPARAISRVKCHPSPSADRWLGVRKMATARSITTHPRHHAIATWLPIGEFRVLCVTEFGPPGASDFFLRRPTQVSWKSPPVEHETRTTSTGERSRARNRTWPKCHASKGASSSSPPSLSGERDPRFVPFLFSLSGRVNLESTVERHQVVSSPSSRALTLANPLARSHLRSRFRSRSFEERIFSRSFCETPLFFPTPNATHATFTSRFGG